jgi:hypothetical protein
LAFGPNLSYVTGEKNIRADALRRLELQDDKASSNLAMLYQNIEYLLKYTNISIVQQADTNMRK